MNTERLKSLIFDSFISVIFSSLLFFTIFIKLKDIGIYHFELLSKPEMDNNIIYLFSLNILITFLPLLFKDVLLGRSLGKIYFGLQIVSKTTKITFLQLIVRNLTLILFPIEFIYFLIKKERLGDFIAGTKVINVEKNELNIKKAFFLYLLFFIGSFSLISILKGANERKTFIQIDASNIYYMDDIEKHIMSLNYKDIDSCSVAQKKVTFSGMDHYISVLVYVNLYSNEFNKRSLTKFNDKIKDIVCLNLPNTKSYFIHIQCEKKLNNWSYLRSKRSYNIPLGGSIR